MLFYPVNFISICTDFCLYFYEVFMFIMLIVYRCHFRMAMLQ